MESIPGYNNRFGKQQSHFSVQFFGIVAYMNSISPAKRNETFLAFLEKGV